MMKRQKKNQKEFSDLHNANFDTLITLLDCFSEIKFLEKNHKYEIAGIPAKKSVSGLISNYEKPFDSKKIAERIAKKDGVSVEDVLYKWEVNKNYSCHKGSEFHLYVENFLERRHIPIDKKALINHLNNPTDQSNYCGSDWLSEDQIVSYYEEMALLIKNFKSFYEWWKQDHILIRSEFVIGDKESGICGTIDNLSYNKKTKEFVIFDYKTNKEIKTDNQYGEYMLDPFGHIPKCELSKYSLQLSLYKLIFEKNTPFKIGYTGIVWVSGKNDYELIDTVDYSNEAKIMLDNA